MATPFLISATVDFPDDCRRIVFDRELLGRLINHLRWIGVRRLYWNYYQAEFLRAFAADSDATAQTLTNLPSPMATACELAHERGLEFFAIIKPYETSTSNASPVDSSIDSLTCIGGVYERTDPWVLAHPHMRVKGRTADLSADLDSIPVERIELRQQHMSPIRIRQQDLQIWTSADNRGFTRKDVQFTVSESVESCSREVRDVLGNRVTAKGESVRALQIDGLHLLDRFIAVTTSLEGGEGTFRNTAVEMVRAYGPGGVPLPIVVASHKSTWQAPL